MATHEELAIQNAAWYRAWNAAVELAARLTEGTQLVNAVPRVMLPNGSTVRQQCADLLLKLAGEMRATLPLLQPAPAAWVVRHDDRDHGAMEAWPAASLAEAQAHAARRQRPLDESPMLADYHFEAYEKLPESVKLWKLHGPCVICNRELDGCGTAAQDGGTRQGEANG